MANKSPYAPPAGGAAWVSPEEFPLRYLAWGARRYGKTPMPPHPCVDWIYVVPVSGAPTILLNGQRKLLPAGYALILSPGCLAGYEDSPRGTCRILTWVWSLPPRYETLRPAPGSGKFLRLSEAQTRDIHAIHDACREEVQQPDAYTAESLASLRTRLDLCLVRGPAGRVSQPSSAHRLALALRWLREHPEAHAPSAGLCNYLQISPATLHRLFRNRLGHGPREESLRLRLAEARRLISQEKWSVKAAAYHLGYKHPNDLSRLLHSRG